MNMSKQTLIGKLYSKPLTQREKEVVVHIANGATNAMIADYMHISLNTAKIHTANIIYKLKAKDRTHAVVKAIKYNIINIY